MYSKKAFWTVVVVAVIAVLFGLFEARQSAAYRGLVYKTIENVRAQILAAKITSKQQQDLLEAIGNSQPKFGGMLFTLSDSSAAGRRRNCWVEGATAGCYPW